MNTSNRLGRGVVLLALSTALAIGWGSGSCAAVVVVIPSFRASPVAGTASVGTDRAIADAQRQLSKTPGEPRATKALASALLQKVREEADPSYYTKADALLAALGGVKSRDPEVLVLEGTLLLARHEFAAAMRLGERIVREWPSVAAGHGILVDAYNELGRYDDALAATQRMVTLRPDRAALARVSYARELRGDTTGAIVAMQQAVSAGEGTGESAAYVQVLLGNLLLSRGEVVQAEAAYSSALRSFPGFAGARVGRAAVAFARGLPSDAAALMSDVVDGLPLPQYLIAQGDYLAASGRSHAARDAYALVDGVAQLYRSNGVRVDLEMALFEADHHPSRELLDSIRRIVAERPSVTAHHSLAWVLHRLGKRTEALAAIRKAVSLGERDPVLRFHAAAIAAAAGDTRAAGEHLDLVLAGNPRVAGIVPAELTRLAASLGRSVAGPALVAVPNASS